MDDPVSVVRRAYEAWNSGAVEQLVPFFAPDCRFHGALLYPDRVYPGHAGLREALGDLLGHWDAFRLRVDELHDAGDGLVLAVGHAFAASRTSGLSLDAVMFGASQVRDGVIFEHGMLFTEGRIAEAGGWAGEQLSRLPPEVRARLAG